MQTNRLVSTLFVLLSSSMPVVAGGPPRLTLPLAGVDAKNVDACTRQLNEGLDDHLWKHPGRPSDVRVERHRKTWYLSCYIVKPLGLENVRDALRGTGVTLAEEKLRFFGQVVLVVDPRGADAGELDKAVEAIGFVSVGDTQRVGERLNLVVDMPFPVSRVRLQDDDLSWTTFRRGDFSSDQSTRRTEQPIDATRLPTLAVLRNALSDKGAVLEDARWEARWGCRHLGCTVAKSERESRTPSVDATSR